MGMKGRRLALLGACWVAMILAVSLPATLAGQAPARARTTLRTPWGAPDLQGIWSHPVVVPLERSREFGTREFLTPAEHAKAERELLERNKRPGRDSRTVGGKTVSRMVPAVLTDETLRYSDRDRPR